MRRKEKEEKEKRWEIAEREKKLRRLIKGALKISLLIDEKESRVAREQGSASDANMRWIRAKFERRKVARKRLLLTKKLISRDERALRDFIELRRTRTRRLSEQYLERRYGKCGSFDCERLTCEDYESRVSRMVCHGVASTQYDEDDQLVNTGNTNYGNGLPEVLLLPSFSQISANATSSAIFTLPPRSIVKYPLSSPSFSLESLSAITKSVSNLVPISKQSLLRILHSVELILGEGSA